MPEYVIRCTPGGLLRDNTGKVICFATRAEAAVEAARLTQEADSNSRVAAVDFHDGDPPRRVAVSTFAWRASASFSRE
jgi:hypothetical protein